MLRLKDSLLVTNPLSILLPPKLSSNNNEGYILSAFLSVSRPIPV